MIEYKLCCASCRCEIYIQVDPYPHGPQELTCCPICKTDHWDNLNIQRNYDGQKRLGESRGLQEEES